MPVYSIINPSDAYTIEGDLKACCLVTLLLGDGAYGLRDEADKEVMPLMFLGIGQEKFFENSFGKSLEEVTKSVDHATLADCLDSILPGGFEDRGGILAELSAISDPQIRENHRFEILLDRTSSLNQIARFAWKCAKDIRKAIANGNPAAN